MLELHQSMHCHGIYLHALSYECNMGSVGSSGSVGGGIGGGINNNSTTINTSDTTNSAAIPNTTDSWSFESPWPDWALPFTN